MLRIAVLVLGLAATSAASALNVFVCEPEWGSLVQELAGDVAETTVATTAFQDPHRLQARPSLIAAVRRADLIVCTGADLQRFRPETRDIFWRRIMCAASRFR
jgi:zinc/manganese transport system substrate-binding protein